MKTINPCTDLKIGELLNGFKSKTLDASSHWTFMAHVSGCEFCLDALTNYLLETIVVPRLAEGIRPFIKGHEAEVRKFLS